MTSTLSAVFASVQLATDFVDGARLPNLLLGLLFDLTAIATLAWLTVRRSRSRAVYVFTLVAVNVVVFFVTYLMSAAAVGVNVGFGLFALFGILRFRTGTLPVVEMTYLFAGIALASFNALAFSSLTIVEAIIANTVVIAVLELLGGRWLSAQPSVHSIVYERVELVHPARRRELLSDLQQRMGLDVIGVDVHEVNFLNDTARLSVRVRAASDDRVLVHTAIEDYEP